MTQFAGRALANLCNVLKEHGSAQHETTRAAIYQLETKVDAMALDLTALTAAVEVTNEKETIMVALVSDMKTQIAALSAAKSDPTELQAQIDKLTDTLTTGAKSLAELEASPPPVTPILVPAAPAA